MTRSRTGFGFASVLRELGVGTNGTRIAIPLVSFNLGVELGQVAIAAVLLPADDPHLIEDAPR